MNGNSILFDTNILIRFLNGDQSLVSIIDESDKHISFLTEVELFCKPGLTEPEKQSIKELISACNVLHYAEAMKEIIITLRIRHRLKMPDAFIAATSLYYKLPLYTYDKGFSEIESLGLFLPKQ